MKVGTQLRVSRLLLVASVVVSSIVLGASIVGVRQAIRTTRTADLAIERVLELSQLTAEIEFRWEARPIEQWRSVQAGLAQTIDNLAGLLHGPDEAALHDRLRHNNVNVTALFERWTSDSTPGGASARPAASRLIADSIMTRLRAMEAVSQRLAGDGNAFVSEQITRLAVLLFGCLAMIGSAALAISFARRRIVSSLRTLGDAAGQIERGDSVLKVEISGNDEFALLGRTLVDMSKRIAQSHAEVVDANQRLRQVAADREAAETRLRAAIDVMESGFALFDAEDRLVICNDGFVDEETKATLGRPIGRTFEEIFRAFARADLTAVAAPGDREKWLEWRVALHRNPPKEAFEIEWTNGQWVRVTERRLADGGSVGLWTDITDIKRRESQLGESQRALALTNTELARNSAMLQAIADTMPVFVSVVDADLRYRFCNRHHCASFGLDRDTVVGKRVEDVLHPAIFAAAMPHVTKALKGERVSFTWSIAMKDGRERVLEQHYIPDVAPDGSVAAFYSIGVDVTDRHRREAHLDLAANTDPLTGLMNRRAVIDAIQADSERWAAEGPGGAILFLDIDHFKQINDTYGHDKGDELLKVFASRLRASVRNSDRVARLGGDEFVILLTAPNAEEVARRVAQKILDSARQPIRLGSQTLMVGTSIGVAAFPFQPSGDGATPAARPSPAQLLKQADLALYEAKKAGRGRYMARIGDMLESAEVEAPARKAPPRRTSRRLAGAGSAMEAASLETEPAHS
jgi:diguanylate cyclase (GGDEF)-like protein/PAS domain S-box-containing protein